MLSEFICIQKSRQQKIHRAVVTLHPGWKHYEGRWIWCAITLLKGLAKGHISSVWNMHLMLFSFFHESLSTEEKRGPDEQVQKWLSIETLVYSKYATLTLSNRLRAKSFSELMPLFMDSVMLKGQGRQRRLFSFWIPNFPCRICLSVLVPLGKMGFPDIQKSKRIRPTKLSRYRSPTPNFSTVCFLPHPRLVFF